MSEERVLSYATESPLLAVGELFREGEWMVVRDGVELPRRCILCDAAVEGEVAAVALGFSWDSSFRMTKASTLELRKAGSVRVFLCGRHRRRWGIGRAMGFAGMLVSGGVMLVGAVMAVVSENADVPRYTGEGIMLMVLGFGMMIGFLFLFTLRTRTLSCVKIDRGYLWLKGVDGVFLAGLKEMPGK